MYVWEYRASKVENIKFIEYPLTISSESQVKLSWNIPNLCNQFIVTVDNNTFTTTTSSIIVNQDVNIVMKHCVSIIAMSNWLGVMNSTLVKYCWWSHATYMSVFIAGSSGSITHDVFSIFEPINILCGRSHEEISGVVYFQYSMTNNTSCASNHFSSSPAGTG